MEPQSRPAHVYAAITAIRASLAQTGISKSRENKDQKYKFRGIDEVYNAVSALLAEHQLCIMPSFSERLVSERTTKSGGAMFSVTVRGAFAFVSAVDGSSHTVVTYGEAMDTADKATNKAMSAAMKYCVLETFTVPTEGDDHDADERTPDVAAYTKAEQDLLAGLNTAAADGSQSRRRSRQKLSVEQRERLRAELPKLKGIAEKNDDAHAQAQAANEVTDRRNAEAA